MSYDAAIASALRLISTKGTACTWRSTTPVVDVVEPWKESSITETEYATHVVLLPFDSVARRMFRYAADAPTPSGVLLGYVPGSEEFSPALRDTIVTGDKTYTVASFDALNPNAEKDIVYVLELHQ